MSDDAFDALRALIGKPRAPRLDTQKHADELVQMQASDGLEVIKQYDTALHTTPTSVPEYTPEMEEQKQLWVVRVDDTFMAPEHCAFGEALGNQCVKHTNLTGGAPAFSGGELLSIGHREILLNGCSGRYGPRNSHEMAIAAAAFLKAGYRTWSTGFDAGAGRCFRFGASLPFEVLST